MFRQKMELTSVTRTRLFVGLETAENHEEIDPELVKALIERNVKAGTFYSAVGLWMSSEVAF